MSIKHNKLRNSGLLFELLVRQFTTDTLNNKDSKTVGILKEYFHNTDIFKEYQVYNTIAKSRNLSESKADVLINACIESYKKLNKAKLREQKYKLVAAIKENYNIDDFFKAKVDNYTVLASIYTLLEMHASDSIDIEDYTKCKTTLLEYVTSKKASEKDVLVEEFAASDEGTRELIYKMTVNKFNERYSNLNESQKNLLKEYINNISTSNKLKDYCNEQVKIIKKDLKQIMDTTPDQVRKVKLQEIAKLINEVPVNKTITEGDVSNILNYMELIKEYRAVEPIKQ